MELDVVIISSTSQLYEVPASPGCVLVVHLFHFETAKTKQNLRLHCSRCMKRKADNSTVKIHKRRNKMKKKRRRKSTSRVKEPMEVSRVTSGAPPSELAHISFSPTVTLFAQLRESAAGGARGIILKNSNCCTTSFVILFIRTLSFRFLINPLQNPRTMNWIWKSQNLRPMPSYANNQKSGCDRQWCRRRRESVHWFGSSLGRLPILYSLCKWTLISS